MCPEKLENILQNPRPVKSVRGYTPATLQCKSPGCDQKWHILSSCSVSVSIKVADAGRYVITITASFSSTSRVLKVDAL